MYATSPSAADDESESPTLGTRIKLSTYKTASILAAIILLPSNAATPGPVDPHGKIPVG